MEIRTYHGDLNPDELANVLMAQFNQGNFAAQRYNQGNRVIVQVGTRDNRGRVENALAVTLSGTPEGVNVSVGEQQWLDAAADLGGNPAKMAVACPYCGVANPPGAPTCTGCGAPLGEAQPVYCPRCGQQMQAGSKFCPRCGHKF